MSNGLKTRMALCMNNKWRYTNAEESRKPGYLARRFAKIRADMKRDAEEAEKVVKPLMRVKV